MVEIKADLAEHPEAVTIYSRKEVPNSLSRLVSETLDEQVRQDKLLHYDIPQLPSIMQDVNRKFEYPHGKMGEKTGVRVNPTQERLWQPVWC